MAGVKERWNVMGKWNKFVPNDISTHPPQLRAEYLVTVRELGVTNDVRYIGYMDKAWNGQLVWWNDLGGYRLDDDGYEVIAWMELPEPYKEGDN